MSWISDVKHDLAKLDISLKSLRKFGLTVGPVLIILFGWFFYKDVLIIFRSILLGAGLLLIAAALIFPAGLTTVYKVWMGLAFVLGWLVSRIILTLLFFLVVFPVGVIAKLFGKKFLDAEIDPEKKSYWIRKDNSRINYEKMY